MAKKASTTAMLERMLNLKNDEFRRLGPFFALYALLFGCMAIADGVSLALFIQRVGSANLPVYYGLTALTSLILIYLYLRAAERWSDEALFQFIILAAAAQFSLAYVALCLWPQCAFWYGALFVAREVSYTLILMHFGTYLQGFFSREELNRVLPLVYAGGRVGGIIGAAFLSLLSSRLGLTNLVPIVVACLLGCSALVYRFHHLPLCAEESDGERAVAATTDGLPCGASIGALWQFVTSTPLMLWFSISGVCYMVCRWILNFQYSNYFDAYFASEVELAQYIGYYSQLALLASLLFQVLLVSRLIDRIGLKGTHCLYNVLMAAAFLCNAGGMTMARATFARFVETDLRFSLRNPVNQLITNKFSKATRVKARALTLGAVNPIAMLLSSVFLLVIDRLPGVNVGDAGVGLVVIYGLASWFLYRSFDESAAYKLRWPNLALLLPIKRHQFDKPRQ